MSLFNVPMVPRDGTITITDGSAQVLTVQYEEGDFQAESFRASHHATEVIYDRDVPYAVRETKKEPINFSFSAHATDFADAVERTIPNMVMGTGFFAAGSNSTMGANYPVRTLKIVFTVEQTNHGAGADSVLTLNHCRVDVGFTEGVPGKFTIKGIAIPFADSDVAFT